MQKRTCALVFLVTILLTQYCVLDARSASSMEIDETAIVSRVIDGDTFDTSSGDRIRLADVNTPEQGENGCYEAMNFTIKLVLDMHARI
jgi:endonuclease YncB( thermonuclease family)